MSFFSHRHLQQTLTVSNFHNHHHQNFNLQYQSSLSSSLPTFTTTINALKSSSSISIWIRGFNELCINIISTNPNSPWIKHKSLEFVIVFIRVALSSRSNFKNEYCLWVYFLESLVNFHSYHLYQDPEELVEFSLEFSFKILHVSFWTFSSYYKHVIGSM